jgi:hypothetical protein
MASLSLGKRNHILINLQIYEANLPQLTDAFVNVHFHKSNPGNSGNFPVTSSVLNHDSSASFLKTGSSAKLQDCDIIPWLEYNRFTPNLVSSKFDVVSKEHNAYHVAKTPTFRQSKTPYFGEAFEVNLLDRGLTHLASRASFISSVPVAPISPSLKVSEMNRSPSSPLPSSPTNPSSQRNVRSPTQEMLPKLGNRVVEKYDHFVVSLMAENDEKKHDTFGNICLPLPLLERGYLENEMWLPLLPSFRKNLNVINPEEDCTPGELTGMLDVSVELLENDKWHDQVDYILLIHGAYLPIQIDQVLATYPT